MSNSNELERKIKRLKKEIEREVYDRLPRKVGPVAVNHFKQNFREGGKLPKELPEEAAKWRALALTKKSKFNVRANIPQRQTVFDMSNIY